MEIFYIILIFGNISSSEHVFDNSDHFFYIWLIEAEFVVDDKFYISFFLLSDITIDDWHFAHHQNLHNGCWSSFGDDNV
jgi:hypothetical protein